ncbi:MAG: type I-MYXAN CRISPR-associated protein Cas6/Cmx6 [Rhodocyclales bacterium RIFCSPLOWO2_02_FULL_63_24]|nr:MAG: type I-MYXAN CRISPR-associated protein Cas6/Cmx6 [Rhodocyclales bacterium RIFCSPLOWO2_02_FULL_63_24]
MVDVVFSLEEGTLGDDHARALSQAVRGVLPWFDEEPEAGILPLSGLARGNGVRFVGRRSRLVLRLPIRRSASADSLAGARLDLEGAMLTVGTGSVRPLFPARGVVYSHFVSVGTDDEIEFLARCRTLLAERGLQPRFITGQARELRAAEGLVRGFSLMLHGLGPAESLAVQEAGVGAHRALGCGIFVPHKSVAAVGD